MSKYDGIMEFYKIRLNSVVSESKWFKVDQELIDKFAYVTGNNK